MGGLTKIGEAAAGIIGTMVVFGITLGLARVAQQPE